jgi:hypothetical protein
MGLYRPVMGLLCLTYSIMSIIQKTGRLCSVRTEPSEELKHHFVKFSVPIPNTLYLGNNMRYGFSIINRLKSKKNKTHIGLYCLNSR